MRIGYHLPSYGTIATRTDIAQVARRIEDVGLHSVWVGDHVVFPVESASPYPYSTDGKFPLGYEGAFLEALVVLAFVAGITERVELGTSVLVLPQRHELLVARQLGSLATLAPGRVIAGVGVGWLEEEFAALDRPFRARGKVLDEQLEALRGLWTQHRFGFDGRHVQFPPVHLEPLPPKPPALWVGGNSDAALRRAGRLGDAWHAAGANTADEVGRAMTVVRDAAAGAGRDESEVGLTARIGMGRGPRGLAGLRRRFEMLAEAGCVHVMVDSGPADLDDALGCCEDVAAVADDLRLT